MHPHTNPHPTRTRTPPEPAPPPVHIGRPYRLRIIICGTSAMSGATSATSAANYMVSLTPPAASAGRASIEDCGLGGAGGAIVIGT
jgi:hypothetical protein